MAYNDSIITTLRECFEPDESGQYTNCALVFAYNGTGKTRLSYDFAHFGLEEDMPKHTLYYNAYTEDLFTWENDHENNTNRYLRINQGSQMIRGLAGYNLSESIHKYLSIFSDIDFDFLYNEDNQDLPYGVSFCKHKKGEDGKDIVIKDIKISRGEERLFVWCFFRCIMEHVLSDDPAYKGIEYIYIDDPMSSLDDNNVVAFAAQMYNVIREQKKQEIDAIKAGKTGIRRFKFIISSHHALFFHVMAFGLSADKQLGRYYLSRNKDEDVPVLKRMDDNTPFYYNVAMMAELQKAINSDKLYTYHFNVLRSIMEKIKEFFGHWDFRFILDGIEYNNNRFTLEEDSQLSKEELNDLYSRIVNVFSHQYSVFSSAEMNEDNKRLAKNIFYHIKRKYKFQLPDLDDERSQKEIREDYKNKAKNNTNQTTKRNGNHS